MSKSVSMKICPDCGKQFIALPNQHRNHLEYCSLCHKAWLKEQKRQRDEAAAAEWEQAKKKEAAEFEEKLKHLKTVELTDIPSDPKTLYIIGSGFDLMHGVKSSFYDFGRSIKRRGSLYDALEIAFTPDDIWADFEESLGCIDLDRMGSREIANTWLDAFGFFSDEDESASAFYAAAEAAANPIATVANDLQPALRKWVNGLKLGTEDRPLANLINPEAKALCFNYTDFIEDLYNVHDVCYIHGCRRNKRDELIVGHRPEIETSPLSEKYRESSTYRQTVIDAAQSSALQIVASCDKALTKDSRQIIEGHREFFNGLDDVSTIVVAGHSLSPVDWCYFKEVKKMAPNARWFFGVYGLRGLNNVLDLAEEMNLENCSLFRTDGIKTKPLAELEREGKAKAPERKGL